SHTSETSNISYQSFGLLDNYMYRELKLKQWINPMLPLPSRRQLSGRILEKSTNKIMENILKEAINDKLGVMLAFDS
ncbi:17800_t:CDS:2, partial [Funneliformis caledonium]